MAGFDWDSAGASIGGAIVVIRELISTSTKVEIMRDRMGVVADRLELAKDQFSYMKDVLSHEESLSEKLAQDLNDARAEIQALKLQVEAFNRQAMPETFAERNGILFRRMADGAWSSNAFCPNCRNVLVRNFRGLICSNKSCRWANVSAAHLVPAGLAELKAQDETPGKVKTDWDPLA